MHSEKSTEGAGMWMGIDLGTQGVRAVVASDRGEIIGSGAAPLTGGRDGVRTGRRHPA
ncbi:hypothetical protein [Streptomyces sp. NPDC002346]